MVDSSIANSHAAGLAKAVGNSAPLLEIRNLKTHFFLQQGLVRAVDGIDFTVRQGQTVGIVGESGCGKSVTARSILRIVPSPGRIVEGEILLHRTVPGSSQVSEVVDLAALSSRGKQIHTIRGAEISMIFQEPMSSFSPVHTIGNQIMEAILLHQDVSRSEAREHTIQILDHVGMPQPISVVDRYPHQLSGGMRQRAMIAMALSCTPTLLIADEPTTALDVTTQAQILTLMRNLQQDLGMAIIFITHDLGVIAQMTEYVLVMYLGQIVESADVDSIFYSPLHPYTHALLHSIPQMGHKTKNRLNTVRGSVPDPYAIPTGCPFHLRCPYSDGKRCVQEKPSPREIKPGRFASCHYSEELSLEGISGFPVTQLSESRATGQTD